MEPSENKSYWQATGMAGIIFGFIVFIISLIGSYLTIHSEPTGGLFSGTLVASGIGCLAGAFGGVLAVKLYINEHGPEMTIGKGAIIGLITGIFIALVFQVLGLIWPVIDSSYVDNLQTALIANIEMMEQLPQAQKEDMIDGIYTQMQNYYSASNIIRGLFLGILTYGLLNLISGLLTSKIMGEQPRQLQ